MLTFSANRDAWATIRGFFYQANLTVLRWLYLDDNQELELERGEDIDLVTSALSEPDVEKARLLEQVKVRETNVTLRTASAAEALANCACHLLSNPDSQLAFRYTTTSRIGLESPPLFENEAKPALEAWSELRAGRLPAEKSQEYLSSILTHLRARPRPEGVSEDTWDKFKNFLDGGEARLIRLVEAFEWSTGQSDLDALTETIIERLVIDRHATSVEEAATLHSWLLFRVFRVLSSRDMKRLTYHGLRVEVGAARATSGARTEQYERFFAIMQQLQSEIAAVRTEVEVQGQLARMASAKLHAYIASQIADLSEQHKAIAERILRQESVTPAEVEQAVAHLAAANEFDKAGALLALALSSLHHTGPHVSAGNLLSIWWSTPLPTDMALSLRLHVRALQIAIAIDRGLDYSRLADNAAVLAHRAGDAEGWALLSLALQVPSGVQDYLLPALNLVTTTAEEVDPLTGREIRPEWVLFAHIADVKSSADVWAWLDVVEQMTAAQRQAAFSATIASLSCMHMIDSIWLREADKSSGHQWLFTYQELKRIGDRALDLGLPELWACCVRAQIVVLSEYASDLEGAVHVGTQELAKTEDPTCAFLIEECIGRQYDFHHKPQQALEWLERAAARDTQDFAFDRLIVLLTLSRINSEVSVELAFAQASEAVLLARSREDVPTTALVRALGEQAVAAWRLGKNQAAFDALEEAVERLLDIQDESDRWKDLFMAVGHTSGYLGSVLAFGHPPEKVDSGEPYVAPIPGMFAVRLEHPKAALYRAGHQVAITTQLMWLADALGREERAAHWAARGLAIARLENRQAALATLALPSVPILVQSDRYLEALDSAREGTLVVCALQASYTPEQAPLDMQVDIAQAMGPKPSAVWDEAESMITSLTAPAFGVRLASLAFDDPVVCRLAAVDVAAAYRESAANASSPEVSTTAAELIEDIFVNRLPSADLLSRYDIEVVSSNPGLGFLANLGATLASDIALPTARRFHQNLLDYSKGSLTPLRGFEPRLLAPFFAKYWSDALSRKRLQFKVPALVQTELDAVLNSEAGGRAQGILNAVGLGLAVHLG